MTVQVAKATPARLIDEHWFIRLLEIIPGAVTWLTLLLPIILSLVQPVLVAYFIIAYDLYWMIKSFRLSVNLIRGYHQLHVSQKVNWRERLQWVREPEKYLAKNAALIDLHIARHPEMRRRFWLIDSPARRRYRELLDDREVLSELCAHTHVNLDPEKLYNVVLLATYNESMDILEPSIKSLTEVDYPLSQIILVIAYEERGGPNTEANAKELIKRYGDRFALAMAIKHPDRIAGEVRGKGGNITYAGRKLTAEIQKRGIDPENVIVTTFDSDHRSSKNYFSYLSFLYATDPNRVHKSYQPIPMFYNNIWDAPAPMRVIATGNSFWLLMETMRPKRLRNFAAHAQSLAALIATDYWSVTTIVEDGHQFWRSYFTFDGDHMVVPVFTPIYQDAVLAGTYIRTFQAQFLQLRRWAWGISDFSYVVRNSLANKRIPWPNKIAQIGRLFEGHFSWATAPLILTFVAWLPLYLNRQFSYMSLAHNLPIITSRILTLASITIVVTMFISLISLPPKPARYHGVRFLGMLAQWILLPVTSMGFSAFAAINAQTRLMFGRYLEFYVTEKATKK
jgi:cellulose synthase/poly-beta-1,6-N-acetylglucosamine synthase-like glycosyltransferase